MCIKNDSKLKSCLKFLKTSFSRAKDPLFHLKTVPGTGPEFTELWRQLTWLRSRERSVFDTDRLKMLTLFSSIGDLFETSKTYSEKEQVGEKIELF